MQEKQMVSSNDIRQTNGFGSPGSMTYRTANGIDSRGTPTPTPGSDPTTSPSYSGTPTLTAQYPSTSPHKSKSIQILFLCFTLGCFVLEKISSTCSFKNISKLLIIEIFLQTS